MKTKPTCMSCILYCAPTARRRRRGEKKIGIQNYERLPACCSMEFRAPTEIRPARLQRLRLTPCENTFDWPFRCCCCWLTCRPSAHCSALQPALRPARAHAEPRRSSKADRRRGFVGRPRYSCSCSLVAVDTQLCASRRDRKWDQMKSRRGGGGGGFVRTQPLVGYLSEYLPGSRAPDAAD